MMKENYVYIVYKAQNKESGQVYIGATTRSVEERKKDHFYKATRNSGSIFQEAIGTYGPEAFQWEEIDTANDINELAEKEKQYVLQYNSKENGYNADSGGGIRKKVYQYNIQNYRLVNTYDDLESAANAVNASRKSISAACLGTKKTCKGYYWSYTLSEPFVPDLDARKKQVIQFDLDGNLVAEYISVAEASRQTGLSETSISRCCRKEKHKAGGFVWKYL